MRRHRIRRHALAVVAAVAISVSAGAAIAHQPSACAGHDPHAGIYHPDRLVLIEACKTVTGTVASVKAEADGDFHIRLTLDPGQDALLNDKNRSGQHGDLVLEIICVNPVTQADAVDACATVTGQPHAPPVGAHITATGPYILDTAHGWAEIHALYTWAIR